jgi:hypothetical protein
MLTRHGTCAGPSMSSFRTNNPSTFFLSGETYITDTENTLLIALTDRKRKTDTLSEPARSLLICVPFWDVRWWKRLDFYRM